MKVPNIIHVGWEGKRAGVKYWWIVSLSVGGVVGILLLFGVQLEAKAALWIFGGIAAVCILLMPYWGQRKRTKDIDKYAKLQEQFRDEAKAESEKLKNELARYKARFGNLGQ